MRIKVMNETMRRKNRTAQKIYDKYEINTTHLNA